MTVSFSCRPEVISTSVADCSPSATSRLSILLSRSHNQHDALPFLAGLDRLNGHGQDFCGGVERNFYGGVHSGDQFVFGIGNIHFGVHGPRGHIDLIGEADDFPFKGPIHARNIDGDGLADPDIGNRPFRNGNHQAQKIVLRQAAKSGIAFVGREVPAGSSAPVNA